MNLRRAVQVLGCLFILASLSAAQPRVTLRLVDWADPDEMPVDTAAIAVFRSLHPDIDVLYEPNPGRQYEEKILTGLAAGDPPDVFLLDSKLIPTFTNKNVLLDLRPYVPIDGIDTTIWFPQALAIARKENGLFAFPKGFSPLVVYYNRTAFRGAGIPFPQAGWTWEDFRSAARKLTIDTNHDGQAETYGCSFTNYYFLWIPWVWSAGGDVVDPAGRRAAGFLNSPAAESALQFLIGLRTADSCAPNSGSWVQEEKTGSNNAMFANGAVAMIVDGHWRLQRYLRYSREKKLDFGVAPLPAGPSGLRVNVVYESGWCVPVNTPHPAEAALLAAFMAGDSACRIRAAGRLEIPASRRIAAIAAAEDTSGMEEVFTAEIPFARQPWGSLIERFSEIEWTLQDAVDEVMLNGKELHATMTAYAGRIDGQLASIRQHEHTTFKPISGHTEILLFLGAVAAIVLSLCTVLYLRTARIYRRNGTAAFPFLLPSLIHLTVFVATPIVFSAWLSVHRWDIVVPDQPFVGLDNFREIAGDPSVRNALLNTLLFSLNVPAGMVISLAVALLMNRRVKALGALRTLYFLPSVTSFVAIALVWMWIYHPAFGIANAMLRVFGLPPLQWLNSAGTAMISLVIFSVWMGLGYQMIIFLAGLQGIPGELYEAATIDGASAWQKFRTITLPLLRPTTFFILVTSFIASFQVFTTVYVMTAGGPVGSTDVIVYHVYQAAWEQLRMGYASALSWVLFVIIMIATWVQFRLMGRGMEA